MVFGFANVKRVIQFPSTKLHYFSLPEESLLSILHCRHLTAEHEQLETLTVFCHEKLKEQYLSLAEQRDTTLKSEKFRVKSFQELQQRYLKLQDATKKLYQVGPAVVYKFIGEELLTWGVRVFYLIVMHKIYVLMQNQCRLSSLKANNNEASAQLKAVHEESLIKQDEYVNK